MKGPLISWSLFWQSGSPLENFTLISAGSCESRWSAYTKLQSFLIKNLLNGAGKIFVIRAVLPYLAIYRKFGYFWHQFATKISLWLLGLFGYFFGNFWKLGKKLVLNQFKTGFGSYSLCFYVDIFAFWQSFDVDILGFQKCFDVGLLGVSKI